MAVLTELCDEDRVPITGMTSADAWIVMASTAGRYASVTDRTCLPGIAMLAYKSVDPFVVTCDPGSMRS